MTANGSLTFLTASDFKKAKIYSLVRRGRAVLLALCQGFWGVKKEVKLWLNAYDRMDPSKGTQGPVILGQATSYIYIPKTEMIPMYDKLAHCFFNQISFPSELGNSKTRLFAQEATQWFWTSNKVVVKQASYHSTTSSSFIQPCFYVAYLFTL